MSATPAAERPPVEISPRVPTEADREIGNRLTARRKIVGISQNALAQAVGVTFQQMRKYECGENRVSAGRLHLIAKALGTTIGALVGEEGATSVDRETAALLSEPGAADLLRAFAAISVGEHRSFVIRTAQMMRSAQAEAA